MVKFVIGVFSKRISHSLLFLKSGVSGYRLFNMNFALDIHFKNRLLFYFYLI